MLTKRGIAFLNSTFALVVIASFGFDPLFTPIALIVLTVLGVETMLYAKSLRALRLTTATRKQEQRLSGTYSHQGSNSKRLQDNDTSRGLDSFH